MGYGNIIGARGTGTKGAGLTVVESGVGPIQQTTLTLAAFQVNMPVVNTDDAAGSGTIYTFPAGAILILGATLDLTLTTNCTDHTVNVGIGSAASSNDGDLGDAGEANIIGSTGPTFTDGSVAAKAQSTAALITVLDGTSSAAVSRLNFATASNVGGNDKWIKSTGTIKLTWINLGDY